MFDLGSNFDALLGHLTGTLQAAIASNALPGAVNSISDSFLNLIP